MFRGIFAFGLFAFAGLLASTAHGASDDHLVFGLVRQGNVAGCLRDDISEEEFLKLVEDGKFSGSYHAKSAAISAGHLIVVRAFSGSGLSVELYSVLEKLEFYVARSTSGQRKIGHGAVAERSKQYLLVRVDEELVEFADEPNGTRLRIDVFYRDGRTFDSLFGTRKDRVHAYSFDPIPTRTIGLWVPVGLFGTNFERTEDGVEFVAVPVGAAAGSRINVYKDFYLGFSAIASWSIVSKEIMVNSDNVQEEKRSTVTAKAIGVGALLDVGSWFYVGYIYNFDLSSARDNPGGFAVVGAGTGLIDALSSNEL